MSEQLIQTPSVFGENGNFLLERELGHGGMGGVYMGRDKMLDRPVAVKVMLKEYGADAEFVEKFKKEAQAAAKLIHPNIAQIYTYGISDGMPYIVMELVAGGSLWSIMNMNPGKTDVARVLKICQQVAQALQCSSDQGYVHGDIKPENILLDANGNAKLVDFGLAGMQKDTDEIWGTPYYIAPEKVRQEVVDFRADMYNLGGTLYHALTGVAPFEGEDVNAVVRARFVGAPKKPSDIRPELTPAVDALVLKMLEAEKEKRFPSFEALIEEFKRVLTSGLVIAELPAAETAPARPAASAAAGRKVVMRGGRRPMTTVRKTTAAAGVKRPLADLSGAEASDEDERGGSLGLKVIGVVVGSIALIGLVIGLLVWFKVSAARAAEREENAQIARGITTARTALADTRKAAVKFAADMESFSAEAVRRCTAATRELGKLLPEFVTLMKPQPTKELLAAIASTNRPPAAAAAQTKPAAQAKQPPKVKAAAATNATEVAQVVKKTLEVPAAVGDLSALWERAYSCQAAVIRIRQAMVKVFADCDAAEKIVEPSREAMERLAKLSRDAAERYSEIAASKDVETLRKGAGYIESKGRTIVDQTIKRLRIERLEKERAAKKAAAAAAEKKRQEELAAAKAKLVDEEKAAAKAKFEAIVAQGCLRQLDWKSALRQLKAMKDECKTPEGGFALDNEIRKVEAMQAVHAILRQNLPGYTFRRSALKGCQVAGATEDGLDLVRADGKSRTKMSFVKFYQTCRDNLRESVFRFVRNGRTNNKPPLSLRAWADAMCGAALTATLLCSDDERAAIDGAAIVKAVIEAFPDYEKTVKEMLPDLAAAVPAAKSEDA
jgi:hypothetical protein